MDLGLEGRVALVTGASKGLGRAIAAALAAQGARVAMTSRSRERIDAAAAALGARGFAHDTAEAGAAARLVAEIADALGPVEILVTNSGGPPGGPDPLAFEPEAWEQAHRMLVLGPMALIRAALPAMRARGFGRVLSVSSTAAREPIPDLMLSNAHRPGLAAAFKTLARRYAGDGVTFNTLLAGRIATDRVLSMHGGSRDAAEEAARAEVPAGRLGEPEEYAAAAAFLCSQRAAYITGTALRVDGGLTRSV
jgi:3-oxoacyl-[acyl-carrier protein] reductase